MTEAPARQVGKGPEARLTGMRFTPLAVTVVIGLLIGASAYGCSSSDKKSSDQTTSTQKSSGICAQDEALRQSVTALKDVTVSAAGVQKLKSDLQQVKADTQALAKSLGDELKPDVQAVKASFTTLDKALGSVKSNGLEPVASAVTGIGQSTETLIKNVKAQKCS